MLQASWGRGGKQQQVPTSPNHVQVLFPGPVYDSLIKNCWLLSWFIKQGFFRYSQKCEFCPKWLECDSWFESDSRFVTALILETRVDSNQYLDTVAPSAFAFLLVAVVLFFLVFLPPPLSPPPPTLPTPEVPRTLEGEDGGLRRARGHRRGLGEWTCLIFLQRMTDQQIFTQNGVLFRSYRVAHLVAHLGWSDGNLAEGALQVGMMTEHRNPSQPNNPRPDGPTCTKFDMTTFLYSIITCLLLDI